MLAPDPKADQPRGNPAKDGETFKQAQRQRHLVEYRPAHHQRGQHAVVHQLLRALDHSRRKHAPVLDLVQKRIHVFAACERPSKDVRSGHRILDRKVDAHSADRRHAVRRIADGEQAGPPPARQPVERDREQLDLVPVLERVDDPSEPGRRLGDAGAESGKSGPPDFLRRALRNHVGALPIIAAVELDQERPRAERAAGLVDRRLLLGQPEPQHVDRRAEILLRKPRLVAQERVAAVGGDRQPRPHLLAILQADTGNAPVLNDEVVGFGLHP
jgi:hypothetical protein